MESVDVRYSVPDVENATPNDVKQGHYCLGLVDHLELKPSNVLTSLCPKNETRLVTVDGVEGVHDVGSLLLYPLMELGILQESVTISVLPTIVAKKS
jgi:hypothetical protein